MMEENAKPTSDAALWLRDFRPAPDAPAVLVCLPHAGGAASFFRPVTDALAPRIHTLAVQYPGRQDRRHEPFSADLHDLAEHVAAAVRGAVDRPFALFGHSMGATVAFEAARLLERAGIPPLRLFVSGRRPPGRPTPTPWDLGDGSLLAELRGLDGTDARILDDPELLQMNLPVLRADYAAVSAYEFRETVPLSCPITVFTGSTDPKVTPAEAGGWAAHTTGHCEVQVHPGGHFFLVEHQEAVLRAVAGRLPVTA